MDTQVSHLCKPVVSVDLDTSIQEILNSTSWDKVSSVVVLDKEKKVFGIITEKDMVYAESLGVKKKDLKAWQICSKDIIRISPEDNIIGAAHLMVDNNVHHVLIMVGDYIEGIISSLDVLRKMLERK